MSFWIDPFKFDFMIVFECSFLIFNFDLYHNKYAFDASKKLCKNFYIYRPLFSIFSLK